jgi:hypothetical protein
MIELDLMFQDDDLSKMREDLAILLESCFQSAMAMEFEQAAKVESHKLIFFDSTMAICRFQSCEVCVSSHANSTDVDDRLELLCSSSMLAC